MKKKKVATFGISPKLMTAIDLPNLWNQWGPETQQDLCNSIISHEKLNDLPFSPDGEQTKILILTAIRMESYEQAREFWIVQRDKLEDQPKEAILQNMVTVLGGVIAQEKDSKSLTEFNELLLFMADKKRTKLENIDYWNVICSTTCNKLNVDHQRWAVDFLSEHRELISEFDAKRLHEYLMHEIRSHLLMNDYYANEALTFFTSLYPGALFEDYFRFAMTFLLGRTISEDVAMIVTSMIEKHQKTLNLSNFKSDIQQMVLNLSVKPTSQVSTAHQPTISWLDRVLSKFTEEEQQSLSVHIQRLKRKVQKQ